MGNIQDFHKEHGDDYIVDGGWVYWPDGARRENSSFGVLIDPPKDDHERAKAVKVYWDLRLDRLVKEFSRRRHELQVHAKASMKDAGYPPPASALDELRKLKAEIEEVRKQQQAAEQAVQDTVPGEKRLRAEAAQARRREAEKFLGDLNEIEV